MLWELLATLPKPDHNTELLVRNDTGEDAAIYRINEHRALVATTDCFMPVVDDPFDFGWIAPTTPFRTSMPWAAARC